LPYVLAARERNLGPFDELILVNDEGRAVEASSSNLFAFLHGRLVTPPESEGGIPGIMRSVILQVARKAGINVAQEPLSLGDVEAAEEVFLTNAVQGMRWVARFRAKRYPNQFAVGLFGKFEEKVLAELTRPWPPR
jgi:branched-chain amino acid aminotransferase